MLCVYKFLELDCFMVILYKLIRKSVLIMIFFKPSLIVLQNSIL